MAAVYNRFPLVTSDTGAYIAGIFGNLVPKDRPITYSIFIYASSMHISAWLPIFMQSIWLSALIYLIIKSLLPINKNILISFFFIIALSAFTSVSWFCSQLMPDIFTPIMFLSIYLIMIKNNMYRFTRFFLYASLFTSVLMHNSNILIAIIFLTGILIFFKAKGLGHYIKRLRSQLIITFSAAFILSSIHLIGGYGFTLSRSTDVFLVGKMCENGVMANYLHDNCADRKYYLCDYKDKLPEHAWEFIWDENGPLAAGGGWNGTKKENKEMLYGIFTSPKHLFSYLKKCIQDTFTQFFLYHIGDGLVPHIEPGNAHKQISKYFENELHDYTESKQNTIPLPFDIFNYLYLFVILSSIIAVSYTLIVQRKPFTFELKLLLFGVLFFLVCNAFITASLANILSRLQSRAIWLLPFACWLVIFYQYLPKQLRSNATKNLSN
jgi:hypothetical protein